MGNINRTKSQYYGVDVSLVTDENIKSTQSSGIGVGAKLKALNVADPENGVKAFVIDAFDIDWTGYKIDGENITNSGQLIEAIKNMYGSMTDPWMIYESEGTETSGE